jgi:tRNA A-37 threonylcarbamoyl transferase component Bud32
MILSIHAVEPEDAPFIRTVMARLLRAYDGRRLHWALPNSEELWRIHPGWRASVVGMRLEGRKCCAKFFHDRRWRAHARNRLGFSKARRSFRKARRLERLGVPAPAVWGFAVDWVSGYAVLVAELVEHADSVDHHVEREGADAALAARLGRFVRRMHEAGVAHKDLSLSNFLRQSDGRFLLVDYEDCRFFKTLPERVRWANLRHLDARARDFVSLEWRRVFLRAYWERASRGRAAPPPEFAVPRGRETAASAGDVPAPPGGLTGATPVPPVSGPARTCPPTGA